MFIREGFTAITYDHRTLETISPLSSAIFPGFHIEYTVACVCVFGICKLGFLTNATSYFGSVLWKQESEPSLHDRGSFTQH